MWTFVRVVLMTPAWIFQWLMLKYVWLGRAFGCSNEDLMPSLMQWARVLLWLIRPWRYVNARWPWKRPWEGDDSIH